MAYTYRHFRARNRSNDDLAPFEVRRYGRHWEVRDPAGEIVCLAVYRRGAVEVIRRLKGLPSQEQQARPVVSTRI